MELSINAIRIIEARYLKKDEKGKIIETPEEMFQRVARYVAQAEKTFDSQARVEKYAESFYQTMSSLEFLPNSPTLMNACRELGQLSACFVLPIKDSLESIFESLKNTALIHQSGGGTGFSFSHLRPKNDIVSTTSGIASGPVSFMEVFNKATDIIKQGGTRRGANMGILRADHPDIEEFITLKRTPLKLESFNLSVGIPDKFMQAVKADTTYGLINPRTQKLVRTVSAKDLFNLIIQCAWDNGEPGILFLDRINRDNPTPHLGQIESTNPCGEQPLLPFESCNLGSINLAKMLRKADGMYELDWRKLEKTVCLAVRFLDDVIEVNRYPLPQIRQISRANRKIGLGIMGFAHLLILLGISYNSEQSLALASEIMNFIQEKGHEASQELAGQRDAFPNFPASIYNLSNQPPIRNATVTTIAPTGTLSLIAGCSAGIEPIYALFSTRIAAGNIDISEMDPLFRKMAADLAFLSPELEKKIRETGQLGNNPAIPAKIRNLFMTAFAISPSQHVRIQAAFQQHTDNAVSKTINFPSGVTPDEIRDALLLAFDLECKGVTVYRDQSRAGQVFRCGLERLC